MYKKIYLSAISILGILFLISCSKNEDLKYKQINLTSGWKIHQADSTLTDGAKLTSAQQTVTGWYDAVVPSTVMGTLVNNNVYPDIFNSNNIKNIDKTLFDKPWWYRTEFKLPQLKEDQHIFINFDGISYYANVWLNGKLIASRDSIYGTYRRFSLEITPFISDNNILAIELFKAQPGDPNVGFADWNPRPADDNMGIFREVTLVITGGVKLNNTNVKTDVNTETLDEAWLSVETEVENLTDKPILGQITGKLGKEDFTFPVSLAANEKRTVRITSKEVPLFHINNPRLWWCNNLGSPELYDLELNFSISDTITYQDTITFGIRKIETYFTEDDHRGFKLNGKKVLLKSAGWTDDIFLRDTPQSNEHQVQLVKDMNLNMIRFENFWGTSSNIYDLCDKYGLMALIGWSCQWEWEAYYGKPCDDTYGCILTDKEVSLVAESFADQVLWLRNHPSIIGWMPGSDMLPTPKLEEKYLAFLKEADDRPYIGAAKQRTSSLSGKTGTKMAGPYEYVGPNYWYIDTLYGGAFGFNTETGIGAQLPVLESITKFIPSDKLWPINDSWNYHCTASTTAMNSLNVLNDVITNKYGEAKNLNDFLLKADLVNYDGTRAMFEAFRVNIGKTTGIVQWMLNSAWPSLYWQLYDYYKIPTAAYYSVKKANQPLQLIYNYGNNTVYAVNERLEDRENYRAVIKVYDLNSKLRQEQEIKLNINSNTAVDIFKLDPLKENVFVSLQLFDNEGQFVTDNFYCISSTQDEYLWNQTDWVHTPAKSYSDFKNLANIPSAKLDITYDIKENKEKVVYTFKIKNTSSSIAFFTNLKLKNQNGEMVSPAFWEDNYISLLPMQEKTIECTVYRRDIENQTLKVNISGWNSPLISLNI